MSDYYFRDSGKLIQKEDKAMMDKEEILQWAKMVGEYRLPDIIERFERYKKAITEKKREALEEKAN
jgi:hypothetical protein